MNDDKFEIERSGKNVTVSLASGEVKTYSFDSEGLAIWFVKYIIHVRFGIFGGLK